MCYVTFFKKDALDQLQQLPQSAALELILHAASNTLKLKNQKNGWNGVCIKHEWNGDDVFDPVWALA